MATPATTSADGARIGALLPAAPVCSAVLVCSAAPVYSARAVLRP
jgi:hypothetical protein